MNDMWKIERKIIINFDMKMCNMLAVFSSLDNKLKYDMTFRVDAPNVYIAIH